MDGVALASIAAGVPTVSFIISTTVLVMKIGKWQGTIEQILKGHDETIKSQKEVCKEQKISCGKRFDYVQSRVNHASDEK